MEETGKKSAEESESLYVGSSALSSGASNLRTSSHSPRQEDDDDKEHEKTLYFQDVMSKYIYFWLIYSVLYVLNIDSYR